MALPVVGLVVASPTPPGLAKLVVTLRRWCRPIVPTSSAPAPVAWITTGPAVEVASAAPRAVWISTREDLEDPGAASAAVLMTDDATLAASASRPIVVVGGTIDLTGIPRLTPHVRARYRRARHLPDVLLIDARATPVVQLPDRRPIPEDLETTATALASAAVVTGPRLLRAMAWATPCVTDAASAAAVGAEPGAHAVVTNSEQAVGAVEALAADEALAAAMSYGGRRLVEDHHDTDAAARRVATALGLWSAGAVSGALDELRTPAWARIRVRAREAARA